MKYTVVWIRVARAQLTNLWIHASDRQAVTDSSDRIEWELGRDADMKGIELWPLRAYYDDPLAVLYTVDPVDRVVRITQVKRIK